jgi:hypothetical protein
MKQSILLAAEGILVFGQTLIVALYVGTWTGRMFDVARNIVRSKRLL